MADVANSMNSSTPTKTHMAQIIPGSPDSAVLSPGVKEAMDRIFPRTATQLLQGRLSFEEQLSNRSSVGTSKEPIQQNVNPVLVTALQSKAPTSHITTLANTDLSMPASTDIAFRNGSTFTGSSPIPTTGSHQVIHAPLSNEEAFEPGSKVQDLSMKSQHKNRISKADFEIVTSCDAFINEYERASRRIKHVDLSSSECPSRNDSDSEDMRRPFASIAKEKKKRKKRRKNADKNVEIINNCLPKHDVNSGDEFTTAKYWQTNDKSSTNRDSGTDKRVSPPDFGAITQTSEQNLHHESFTSATIVKNNTLGFSEKTQDNNSHNYILDNQPLKDNFYKDWGMTSEDISNISYSSAKENVRREKRHSRQKLPKTRRQHFHIVRHIKKIRNTFLPCFVILRKLNNVNMYNDMQDGVDNILPLPIRVNYLSDLCDKGTLACRRNKKTEEVMYKNIFEDVPLFGVSDDDFEKPRVRSLRKRDKNISYVEPSEDDILGEFSRKRARGKNKDVGKSGDESSSESKKGKWHDFPKTILSSPADSYGGSDHISVLDKNMVNTEKGKQDGPKEIIVYPRTPMNNALPYFARSEGRDLLPAHMHEKSKHMYSQDASKNITTYISVLPSAVPGAFPSHPAQVPPYPTLPLSFPGGLAAQPFVGAAPTSCQTSAASGPQNPCQFYVVRMNGKDVLLRFVPAGGPGAQSQPVLPKGKTLITPPSLTHMFNQPVRQTHSIPVPRQTMQRQIPFAVTASHGNDVSTPPLSSLYGMPFINRPAHPNSQDMSPFPTLPIIPSAHLPGHVSTAGIRPMSLTSSGTYTTSHSSVSGLSSSVFASTVSGTTPSFRPVVSSTVSTQAVPDPLAHMSAPNITTLVRGVRLPGSNIHATAPNQSTSLRSIRIFVPGCTTTGTPGRFATLGTMANNSSGTHLSSSSSPLTHLSANSSLLPQYRKNNDDVLSSEQRAAKRRKLEKKYPLPPGVVIKTEPLDSPSKPCTIITCKSLLPSSISGSNVQRFRIINPSTTNALGVRDAGSSSLYRTASVGGGQIVFVPTSLGLIPTTTTTTSPISTSSTSSVVTSLASAAITTITNNDTPCSSSKSFPADGMMNSYRRAVGSYAPLSKPATTENNIPHTSTTIHPGTTIHSPTFGDRLSSSVTSYESTISMNGTSRPSSSSLNISTESTLFSNDTTQLHQSKTPPVIAYLDSIRSNLEELQKMIHIQESRGLKGERLDKLKELLYRKEQHYSELQKLSTYKTADSGNLFDCDESRGCGSGVVDGGATETNPFVID